MACFSSHNTESQFLFNSPVVLATKIEMKIWSDFQLKIQASMFSDWYQEVDQLPHYPCPIHWLLGLDLSEVDILSFRIWSYNSAIFCTPKKKNSRWEFIHPFTSLTAIPIFVKKKNQENWGSPMTTVLSASSLFELVSFYISGFLGLLSQAVKQACVACWCF